MITTWRELKDGSIVASTKEQRFRISAYGDGSWLLEAGAVRLSPMDRYVSRAHALAIALRSLLGKPLVDAIPADAVVSTAGGSVRLPAIAGERRTA